MKIFKRLIMSVAAFSIVSMNGFINASGVTFAEEVPNYRLQVSPVRIELELEPGKATTTEFRVQNTGKKEFGFELSTAPFSVVDEQYTQDVVSETKYTYIKDWITFSEDKGKVPAGGEQKITATVNVPKDAPDGGQYGVIFVRMKELDGDPGGVKSEKQIGILVYSANVEGNTRKAGTVLENKVPGFLFTAPVRVTSVVENTGNVHVRAQYILQVFPLFGNEEVYTNEEQPESQVILPETRKLNTMTWDGAPQLGVFRVKQTVKFLDEESVTEKVVFICPLWFLFIVLAVVFLAVFWIISRVRGRRKEQA